MNSPCPLSQDLAQGGGNMPIVLESNQNHAMAGETEICPTLPASMGEGGGYVPMIVMQRRFSNVFVSDTDISPTIEAGGGEGGNNLPMILDALPFDTTQVTSDKNWSHPIWGGCCHPLASGAHPPAVVVRIENDESVQSDKPERGIP